jgi:hypothetical protein
MRSRVGCIFIVTAERTSRIEKRPRLESGDMGAMPQVKSGFQHEVTAPRDDAQMLLRPYYINTKDTHQQDSTHPRLEARHIFPHRTTRMDSPHCLLKNNRNPSFITRWRAAEPFLKPVLWHTR